MMNLDGYCELMKVLKNSSDYQNFYKILFYPLEIDSYMEQHKIYEILGELLFRIGIERPSKNEIIDFMIANLCKFNEHFYKKQTVKIEFHNCTADGMKYLKKLSSKLQIPIIYEDSAETHENHPKIICDFKDNSSDDKFMIISSENDTDNNNSNQDKSHDCNLKLKKAIELKLCYNNLKYVIQNARLRKPLKHTHGEWNHRVLMVGRVGSGRKTQACQLAKEFGLILIDFDQMIKEYEQQSRAVEKHSMGFWGFIQEILLKPQCLHNGYVIVSNVISRLYLIMFMEKFKHEPNKIIFIHTNENKCRRRILKQKGIYHDNKTDVDASSTSTSQTTLSSASSACGENVNLYLDYQMNLYNLHKKDFLRYFASTKDLREKIYHVNGNGSVNDIKSWIWAYFCDV
ncbi:hypothetical protein ACKWTF_001041 [Chironomus riparius]